MASFRGIAFSERASDGFTSDFDVEANIDAQPTGDTVSFDVGDPGPEQIEVAAICTADDKASLMAAAKAGLDGTLVLSTGTRYALIKSVRGARMYAKTPDFWFINLTFWSP